MTLDDRPNAPQPTSPQVAKAKKVFTPAELALELPFTLVGATVLGGALGFFLDRWLHTHWIFMLILVDWASPAACEKSCGACLESTTLKAQQGSPPGARDHHTQSRRRASWRRGRCPHREAHGLADPSPWPDRCWRHGSLLPLVLGGRAADRHRVGMAQSSLAGSRLGCPRDASTAQTGAPKPQVPLGTYFLALFRYALIALIVYVIFKVLNVPLVSMMLGLCALGAAAIAASVYEIAPANTGR